METRAKRQKLDPVQQEESKVTALGQVREAEDHEQTVIIQFRNQEELDVGFEISVPTTTSKGELNKLLSEVREPEDGEDEHQRFQFYLDDKEIKASI